MSTVEVDIKELFQAGAHFGHRTSRWHPKMGAYIHSAKDGNHIIDLTKTVKCLDVALAFLESVAEKGKPVLFVGTKKQAHDLVEELAKDTDMPYVNERWLGGMLTNVTTMSERIKHLKDIELKMSSGQLASKYSKLEVQRFQEEIDAMNHLYGGIKNLSGKPGALFVIDIVHEANAIKEAKKLKVPIVAIVDTNADPNLVDYPIPANDDAIKTIKLILGYAGQAINVGKASRQKKPEKPVEEAK
jgi:small subunit ribosomal protein S2